MSHELSPASSLNTVADDMARHAQRFLSAAKLSNARPAAANKAGDLQQQSLHKVQRYLDAAVDEESAENPDVKANRQWLMGHWTRYFQSKQVDPDGIWLGLCENDRTATAWTKTFFSDYVERSVKSVMVLGPEEYVDKRMLNSALTAIGMWRKLVKEADLTVLRAKRQQDQRAADKWRLRFQCQNSRFTSTSSNATYEISLWIWHGLAEEANLTKELSYDKLEACAEDVILALRTLWERAADLGISVAHRVAFHANILLSAMGGFRPGCLGKVRYRDVLLSILRDPRCPSRTKHVATISIARNKVRNSLSTRRDKKVKFSVFCIPFSLVCLCRLIIARAIQDDAFDAGFTEVGEFLTRPALGDVDYIELQWKPKVLDRFIFQLSYRQFNDIWQRVCMAAGLRTLPRLYAMRVGAGARLDENPLFSNALRDYIMSHTSDVFEAQYQTTRVRGDLMQAAFGKKTGSDNAPLFAALRNVSLSRDPNAPTELTVDDRAEFDRRDDATTLSTAKEEARQAGDEQFFKVLDSRLKYLRRAWTAMKLRDNRRIYFEEADRLRAQGRQPPVNLGQVSSVAAVLRVHKGNTQMAAQVFKYFLRTWNASGDDEDLQRSLELLVAYLKRSVKAQMEHWEEELCEETTDSEADDADETEGNSCSESAGRKREAANADNEELRSSAKIFKCLICVLPYSDRKSLTAHYDKHITQGLFDEPFRCPECRLNKVDVELKPGYRPWMNHLERYHGPNEIPHLRASEKLAKKYPCPFPRCETGRQKYFSARGLPIHTSSSRHREQMGPDTGTLVTALQCRICLPQGTVHQISSLWDWRRHCDLAHHGLNAEVHQCLLCSEMFRTAPGRKQHVHYAHVVREKRFHRPFACPECLRLGSTDAPQVSGRDDWEDHNARRHNGGIKGIDADESVPDEDIPPFHPCTTCLDGPRRQGDYPDHLMAHHPIEDHADLLDTPLPCPGRVRGGRDSVTLFKSKEAGMDQALQEPPSDRTEIATRLREVCPISRQEPFQRPGCARQGTGDTEHFENEHFETLHVLQQHPANSTKSDSCLDASSLDVLLPAATLEYQRAKRKRDSGSSAETATQGRCPDLLQSGESSTTSRTNCDDTSRIWDESSEESLTLETSNSDPDSMIHLDRNSKRSRVKRDLRPRQKSSLSRGSSVDSEDIPIDPYLLGLK